MLNGRSVPYIDNLVLLVALRPKESENLGVFERRHGKHIPICMYGMYVWYGMGSMIT